MSINDLQLQLDRAAKIEALLIESGKAPDIAAKEALVAVGFSTSGVPLKDDPGVVDTATTDALVTQIIGGSLDARSRLLKLVGQQKADEIAKTIGLNSITDFKNKPTTVAKALDDKERANNPWSKAGWSLAKQGACIQALGLKKAGEVAASAGGAYIGITHPLA